MEHMLQEQLIRDVKTLCGLPEGRQVGSAGNRKATAYAAGRLRDMGYGVQEKSFGCLDWEESGCRIRAGKEDVAGFVSPWSLPCALTAPWVCAGTIEELEETDMEGRIVVLHGQLCQEQLMPKNFVFYNPEHHRRIIGRLEAGRPAAIVAITGKNPELAGALYPFPLIEDGDVDIPSVYVKDTEGEKILGQAPGLLTLEIRSRRRKATGANVVARLEGSSGRRVVLTAHIDAKKDTPGALDNAAGVATLLGLAERTVRRPVRHTVEVVFLNGEDDYAQPGQMLYLEDNADAMDDILLNINVDGAGCRGVRDGYCTIGWPEKGSGLLEPLSDRTAFAVMDPWMQGDHMLFVMAGIPALAVTSENLDEVMGEIAHTPQDTPDRISPEKLVRLSAALDRLLLALDEQGMGE